MKKIINVLLFVLLTNCVFGQIDTPILWGDTFPSSIPPTTLLDYFESKEGVDTVKVIFQNINAYGDLENKKGFLVRDWWYGTQPYYGGMPIYTFNNFKTYVARYIFDYTQNYNLDSIFNYKEFEWEENFQIGGSENYLFEKCINCKSNAFWLFTKQESKLLPIEKIIQIPGVESFTNVNKYTSLVCVGRTYDKNNVFTQIIYTIKNDQ